MHRGHAILAGLVALAAVWAYFATHPVGGTAGGEGAAPVWDVPLRNVEAFTYQDGETRVVLRPRWDGDADTPYVWIEVEAPAPQGQAAPGADGGTSAFKGNAAALETLRHFATLSPERDLGALARLDGEAFGLPSEDASLELNRRDAAPLRLQLGRATYGETGRYALLAGAGRVYLLRSAELRRLATARASLMDRELLDLTAEAAARMELAAAGVTKAFHRLEAGGEAGRWAAEGAAEAEPDVAALLAALSKLTVLRYLGPEEAGAALPEPSLELRLYSAAGEAPVAWVRLYPAQGETARAESSHTRQPVLLAAPMVQPVLQKARTLLHDT